MKQLKILIIERIMEMKKYYGQEFKGSRFGNITVNEVPICEVDFKKLSNEDLILVFEQITRRYYSQM